MNGEPTSEEAVVADAHADDARVIADPDPDPDPDPESDASLEEQPAPLGNRTLQRKRSGGVMLGAAMLGLRDVIYGKPKEDSAIEIESSGDPPNIDLDGLDEFFDDNHRLVGPPMDELKSRGRPLRRRRGRRSTSTESQ